LEAKANAACGAMTGPHCTAQVTDLIPSNSPDPLVGSGNKWMLDTFLQNSQRTAGLTNSLSGERIDLRRLYFVEARVFNHLQKLEA